MCIQKQFSEALRASTAAASKIQIAGVVVSSSASCPPYSTFRSARMTFRSVNHFASIDSCLLSLRLKTL